MSKAQRTNRIFRSRFKKSRGKNRLVLVFEAMNDDFSSYQVEYKGWKIKVEKQPQGNWKASYWVDGKTLIYQKKEIKAYSDTYKSAVKKLFNMPFSSGGKSMFKNHFVDYTFNDRESVERAEQFNTYLMAHRVSRHTTIQTKKSNKSQEELSGICQHGIPEEECKYCASWGTNYSGVREYD